ITKPPSKPSGVPKQEQVILLQGGASGKGQERATNDSRVGSRDEMRRCSPPWNTESEGSCGCHATTSSRNAAPSLQF
ncbi:hypothetical protein CEXT_195361, partial [Caerostris extrusa]